MTVPFIFANASGRVPASELDVNFAYVANNVSTANVVVFAAQPNITSVGNLTSLVVDGSVTSTQYIGNGNALTNIPGSNVVGAVAYATTANSVTGGNVSGPVAYATTANSVAGANVFGAVGLATLANTANAVAGANVSGQVGNALVAGTVYTNAQPNITSVGTLSNLSVTGNVRARDFYGISISSDTANLLVSANVADPALNWTFINDYSATGVASLLGPTAGFNQRGEVLLPGRFSTGTVTFTGPDYAAFPDSLVLAAGANISIAQTPDGLGNAATYVTTFDTSGDWYMPGNVAGNYFSGNGRQLTGIIATSSYDNANVTALLSNLGSNVISGTGNITTTANILGNYILGNGSQLTGLSAYGNADVVANLAALGSNPISTTGNVTSGNLLTGGTLSFTGGSRLRPLGANLDIFAGTGSYVNLITSDESSSMGVAGSGGYITTTGGTWSFGTTGNLTAPGNISAVGNVTGNNVLTGGVVSAAGNVRGSNFNTAGLVTATGNVIGGNVLTDGLVSATGNIETSANVLVSGYTSVTGNIDGGNIRTGSAVFAIGNVRGGNILTAGLVTATGNVTAGNVLTGGTVSATGNIRGANLSVGSGNVNVGNVVFALDSSKFNSAKWTLVETISTDLTFGSQVVATTNSYNYYASNYNEVLYLCGAGGNNGTIVIPVSAVTNNSQWNVNNSVGVKWANIANANITVVLLGGPLTTVTVTMYAR